MTVAYEAMEPWWYSFWAALGARVSGLEALLPHTVSVLELAWATPAVFGFARYAWRMVRAWSVLRAFKQERINGELQLIAAMRLLRYTALTVTFEAFCGAAFISMTLPPGPASDPISPPAVMVTALLFMAQAVLILKGEALDHYEVALAEMFHLRTVRERLLAVTNRAERNTLEERVTVAEDAARAHHDAE